MPIIGKFYTSEELRLLLGVSKQRVSNLADEQGWNDSAPRPGLYYAQRVEPYLLRRGIDPLKLKEVSWECPEGEVWGTNNGSY